LTPIFYLHVKKSAGTSIKKMLEPLYVPEKTPINRPRDLSQLDECEYNAWINNYRVNLGSLQLKRCLFAKTILWPDTYEQRFSFTFLRNPYSRAISMFRYLNNNASRLLLLRLLNSKKRGLVNFNYRIRWNAFDRFLTLIDFNRAHYQNNEYIDRHFALHTCGVFDDISDHDGKILLKKIWRIEEVHVAVNQIRAMNNLPEVRNIFQNKTNAEKFSLSQSQKQKIEKLFEADFEIYESLGSTEI
jgi:hypothetical protein